MLSMTRRVRCTWAAVALAFFGLWPYSSGAFGSDGAAGAAGAAETAGTAGGTKGYGVSDL